MSEFTCIKCGKEFDYAPDWQMHKIRCRRPFSYSCKICGGTFWELGHYTEHADTCVRPVTLDRMRREYRLLTRFLLANCPTNPDRTTAIRQLLESMQTAISSIVCADTWQTPEGD